MKEGGREKRKQKDNYFKPCISLYSKFKCRMGHSSTSVLLRQFKQEKMVCLTKYLR